MSTQTEIAHWIKVQGADYILALKANHPTLHKEVEKWFENGLKMPKLLILNTLSTAVMFGLNQDIIAVKNGRLQPWNLITWEVYTNRLNCLVYLRSLSFRTNHCSNCTHTPPREQNRTRGDVLS